MVAKLPINATLVSLTFAAAAMSGVGAKLPNAYRPK